MPICLLFHYFLDVLSVLPITPHSVLFPQTDSQVLWVRLKECLEGHFQGDGNVCEHVVWVVCERLSWGVSGDCLACKEMSGGIFTGFASGRGRVTGRQGGGAAQAPHMCTNPALIFPIWNISGAEGGICGVSSYLIMRNPGIIPWRSPGPESRQARSQPGLMMKPREVEVIVLLL